MVLGSGIRDPGSEIRDPGSGKNPSQIPDPGVKKAPDPGSGSATLKFFQTFAEIFTAQGAPPVSVTPVANGKNLQSEMLQIFSLNTFG